MTLVALGQSLLLMGEFHISISYRAFVNLLQCGGVPIHSSVVNTQKPAIPYGLRVSRLWASRESNPGHPD